MDERFLSDEELAGASGGAAGSEFPRIADNFARASRCADCPNRNIYSARGMCMEVYLDLLAKFSMDKPIGERCERMK